MRRLGLLPNCTVLAAILIVACPRSTLADTRTLVLQIEPRGADASIAEVVDAAIRQAVDTTPSSELASLSVTPGSLRDTLRCTELDTRCLSTAATRTSVDRILFGEVGAANTSTHANVRLRLFDAFLGAIVEAPAVEIPSGDPTNLALGAATLASALLAVPEYGSLTVHAEPGSRVFVDGHLVDLVPGDGSVEVFPVRIGRHEVRVRKPDGRRCDFPVHVGARQSTTVGVQLAAGDDATLSGRGLPDRTRATRPSSAARPTVALDPRTVAGAPASSLAPPRDALAGPVPASRPQARLVDPVIARYGIPIDGPLFLNGSVSGSGAKLVAKIRF